MSDDDDRHVINPLKRARKRADGQCEVLIPHHYLWDRCPGFATDVHHMLPRSRGGALLDRAYEDYHLVVCCRHHHDMIHANPHDAEVRGLTIEGFVVPRGRRPYYTGPDWFLRRKYGDEPEELALHDPAYYAAPRPLAGVARRRPAS